MAEVGIGEGRAVRRIVIGLALVLGGGMLGLPLLVVFGEALRPGLAAFLAALDEPDALAAIRLTLLVAALVVPVNTVFGLTAAWAVGHFRYPGRGLLVALIELPLAVSPVISGLVYVLAFGLQGWLGPVLLAHGVKIVFALPGIVLSSILVTLPFVARQVAPLLQANGAEEEEAALTLGAGFGQMFWRVTLPRLRWALLYGILLCAARSMGEFGAVSVVSGHIRGLTNTMPLEVEILYNEYNLPAAFALAALLAAMAMATIGLRELLEAAQRRATVRGGEAELARSGLDVSGLMGVR